MGHGLHRFRGVILLLSIPAAAAPPAAPPAPGEKDVAQAVRRAAAEALRPVTSASAGVNARVDAILVPALEHQAEELDRASDQVGVPGGANTAGLGLDGKTLEPEISFKGLGKQRGK